MSDGDTEARLSAVVRDRWDGGAVVDFTLDAHQPINGWTLVVEAGGTIVNVWNAKILAQDGTRYTLGAEDYNARVAAGSAVGFGLQVDGAANLRIVSADVVLAAAAAANEDGTLPPLSPPPAHHDGAVAVVPSPYQAPGQHDAAPPGEHDATPPGQHDAAPPATLAEAGAPAVTPAPPTPPARPAATAVEPPAAGDGGDGAAQAPLTVTVTAPVTAEPRGARDGLPADSFAPGPLATRDAEIVDATGAVAPIRGLNWFGFETDTAAPHGLWARNWREMMDEVKDLGFNTLRLPFSGDLARTGGTVSGVDYGLNPDLAGLGGLEIMDAIVKYAGTIGLRVILDYHRGSPGGGPNESGLWFGAGRTEGDVLAEWRTMAERYRDAPAVIAADLVNEPHLATWGDGSPSDWAAAAERIGDAVLSRAPDWLVVVEGVSVYHGDTYWWGGNLQGVTERPVQLSIPGRVVYSPHDYPPSVAAQPWFDAGTPLADVWHKNWGYLVEQRIAPVLLGEWGSRLATGADLAWAHQLRDYLARTDTPWLWWALNPNSGDTGGLFADDWRTVRPAVEALLAPELAATRPAIPFAAAAQRFPAALFTLALGAPASADIAVKYATADGTATAGADYVATAGSLTFARGEQTKTVSVPLLPDGVAEGDESFTLVVTGDAVHATGTAVIADGARERRSALPPDVHLAAAGPSEPATATDLGGVAADPSSDPGAADAATVGSGGAAAQPAEQAVAPGGPDPTAATQHAIELIAAGTFFSGALFDAIVRDVTDAASSGWMPSAAAWEPELHVDTDADASAADLARPDGIGTAGIDFGAVVVVGEVALEALVAAADVVLAAT